MSKKEVISFVRMKFSLFAKKSYCTISIHPSHLLLFVDVAMTFLSQKPHNDDDDILANVIFSFVTIFILIFLFQYFFRTKKYCKKHIQKQFSADARLNDCQKQKDR